MSPGGMRALLVLVAAAIMLCGLAALAIRDGLR